MKTQPKLIFRVEDDQGNGPYNGKISTKGFRNSLLNPLPGDDPLLNGKGVLANYLPPPMLMPSNVIFGFSHAEQAQSWFYDRRIMLQEEWEAFGGHIEVYKLDNKPDISVEAKAQTVFISTHTKDLGSLPLSDLWVETPAQMEADAAAKLKENHK